MDTNHLILRMNLLNEFIEKDLNTPSNHLEEKISVLFEEMENANLNENDFHTLKELKESYHKRKQQKKNSPLEEYRANILKRAFLKYRGLVFDLKTRFDYTSAEVAIQDGLDVSEYFRSVVEEINNDLNECLIVESLKLNQVRDDLSRYYAQFSRQNLANIYPDIARTLKDFREVLDDLNLNVS